MLFILAAVFMTGCQKDFEKTYDLSVDAHEYTLSADGGEFHMYVYCSGQWSAELDSVQDWIVIIPGTEQGSGIGVIRFEAEYNDDEEREVNLIVTSGQFRQTVRISQKYDSTHWEIQ